MDEMVNENEVIEEVAPTEEETGEGISDAEFDEMWENDEDGDEMFAESEAEETDQSSEEQAEETTGTAEAEQPDAEGADQYLELKHLDEVRKVSKEEAKVLAQKGMDYDRIRGKVTKLQEYEDFLNEIKGDFDSIEDLMNDTRARLRMDKDGISYEDALNKTKEERKQTSGSSDREQVLDQIRRESVEAFAVAHPDIPVQDIPKEVWDDLFLTNNLEASYAKYEAKKLRDDNAILKKNAENKARSTGSMKSSGRANMDEYDAMWYEDDY